jgi:hypothetical protein
MRWQRIAVCASMLFALTMWPRVANGQGLQFYGYADFVVSLNNLDSDNSEFTFDNYHFNLIGIGRFIPDLFAAVEVEYEHGGEELEFEYGYLAYTGLNNLTIAAGKFILPFGRFNKDLHPTWINKVPDRPLGFKDVFPQTYPDVGIWLSGGVPLGASGARVSYDAFVVNGLMGADSAGIRGMRGNDREKLSAGGRDNDKSFGGRLGLEFGPQGLEIGTSAYIGNYLDDPDRNLTLSIYGVDAAFRHQGLELRVEGVLANQEVTGGDLTKKGGYGQVAYLIQSRFEPVVRFSLRDMPGESADAQRLSFGLNYYPGPTSAVRIAYHINSEETGFESDNDQLIAQWAIGF